MDIKKSRFSEVKKKMRKMTAVKDKPIKENPIKEKPAKKSNKKQKITQTVKVNVNTSPTPGQPYHLQLPNSFNTDNFKNLQNTIIELLKKNNSPSITEKFNITTAQQLKPTVSTNTEQFNPHASTAQQLKPTVSMETQTENIPKKSMRSQTENIPKASTAQQLKPTVSTAQQLKPTVSTAQQLKPTVSTETQTMDMFSEKVLKPSLYDMINRAKEYNERISMGEEDKLIPLINLPEDTSNLGILERINEEGYGLKPSGEDIKEAKNKAGRKPKTVEEREQTKLTKEENRLKNNKQITNEAFSKLLTKVDDPAEYKELTNMFNTDQLPTKALKKKLLNYGFSKEKIEEIYKNYH